MFVRLNKIMENIILKLMKENNVTQYKLAKETGIAQSTLSYWINGQKIPKVDKLAKVAQFFNVSIDTLLGRESSIKNEPATTQSGSEPDDLDNLLMDFVHRLTADQKKLLLAQLKLMLETQ